MATRRCLSAIARHGNALLSSNSQFLRPLKGLTSFRHLLLQRVSLDPTHRLNHELLCARSFSSQTRDPKNPPVEDEEDEYTESEEDDEDEEGEMESDDEEESEGKSKSAVQRVYSEEEKIQEAADIGYKVIAPLEPSEQVFKPYEPVFAVVQIGSHQFKVSNGDCIYTERLKHCDVNDKLILNKVMLLGSQTQTIVGRPILEEAAVHAVVEEHALDAKVIIFKKKRRKNYRRTKGHRQELTRLRITDIQGIEKPEMPPVEKGKSSSKKAENVPVAA
ncbi:hypothetical protein V2J09_017009 [Rumex salicifolius]